MPDLALSCDCGALQGTARDVSPATALRLVCYCDDCQAFLHALGRPDRMDANGGTDIVQLSPAALAFTQGTEHLACLRLSETGLARFYAACCFTPIGNTLADPRQPFFGLHRSFARSASAGTVEEAVGPVRARVQAKWATGDRSAIAEDRLPIGYFLRLAPRALGWWWRGDGARSPFHRVGPDGGGLSVAARIVPKGSSARPDHPSSRPNTSA